MWRRSAKRARARLSDGDPELIEAITAHVAEHFAAPALIWHERVSVDVHVDIHVVDPGPGRPAKLLVTSGMSERPMAGETGPRYAELLLFLPPDWEVVDAEGRPSWPVTMLQGLAHLPHATGALLWAGHTAANGDPPQPYAPDTELCGVLLDAPALTPPAFGELRAGGRTVQFLAVIPLHAAEIDHALEHDLDALLERLDEAGVNEALQADRPSVV